MLPAAQNRTVKACSGQPTIIDFHREKKKVIWKGKKTRRGEWEKKEKGGGDGVGAKERNGGKTVGESVG